MGRLDLFERCFSTFFGFCFYFGWSGYSICLLGLEKVADFFKLAKNCQINSAFVLG